VKIGNRKLKEFWTKKDLRQGCPLSPLLFNIYIYVRLGGGDGKKSDKRSSNRKREMLVNNICGCDSTANREADMREMGSSYKEKN